MQIVMELQKQRFLNPCCPLEVGFRVEIQQQTKNKQKILIADLRVRAGGGDRDADLHGASKIQVFKPLLPTSGWLPLRNPATNKQKTSQIY